MDQLAEFTRDKHLAISKHFKWNTNFVITERYKLKLHNLRARFISNKLKVLSKF